MTPALIIFIKNPEKGKVKTRLATDIGDENALKVYERLLTLTHDLALAVPTPRYLYYSSFINENDQWDPDHFQKRIQIGRNLGTRMKNAFQEVFLYHSPVIIIGSDCPALSPQLVQEAFEKLKNHDIVVGPAEDGGYYLLGMQHFEPSIFENITWSTETVLNDTLAKVKNRNLSFFLLEELWDLDEMDDLERFSSFFEI